MDLLHKKIIVYGRVQGVYFRASTKAKADELGIKGFVKNQDDGSVYIEAAAPVDKMTTFYEWCKSGPQHARVDEIQIQNLIDTTALGDFEVRYS